MLYNTAKPQAPPTAATSTTRPHKLPEATASRPDEPSTVRGTQVRDGSKGSTKSCIPCIRMEEAMTTSMPADTSCAGTSKRRHALKFAGTTIQPGAAGDTGALRVCRRLLLCLRAGRSMPRLSLRWFFRLSVRRNPVQRPTIRFGREGPKSNLNTPLPAEEGSTSPCPCSPCRPCPSRRRPKRPCRRPNRPCRRRRGRRPSRRPSRRPCPCRPTSGRSRLCRPCQSPSPDSRYSP
mmetsp:Transcript_84412/g.272882  ORF Transcript_84412/g.272882 Transcript_84412/m.272882 type:complete len:235 (-) Transcript_84412:532-1236(-)